jgi:hypothetical protein
MNISINDISNMIFNCIEDKHKYSADKLKLLLHKYSDNLKKNIDDEHKKREIYLETIENPRNIQNNEYDRYLEEKNELYQIYLETNSKDSLYNYLNKSYIFKKTIPDVYTSSIIKIKKPKEKKLKEEKPKEEKHKEEKPKEENPKEKKLKEEKPKEEKPKRGRPKKEEEPKDDKSKRGRPKKEEEPKDDKPKRGRPKKEEEPKKETHKKEIPKETPKENESNKNIFNDETILACGITNFGASCYINSAIQLLIHLKPFNDIILKHKGDNKLVDSYIELYNRYLKKESLDRSIINLTNELNKHLIEIDKILLETQADTSVFLNKFIEKLNINDINNLFNIRINENIKIHDIKLKDKEYKCNENKDKTRNEDSIFLYFEDANKEYNIKTEIENKLNGITEEITNKNNYISCDDIVNKNTNRKTKQNIKFPYSKTEKIATYPDILRVNLNIFDETLEKKFYKMKIPNIISYNTQKYTIVGIIVHEGANLNSGHYKYFSFQNKKWIEYSDTDITSYKENKEGKYFYELNTGDNSYNIFEPGGFIASPYIICYIKNA